MPPVNATTNASPTITRSSSPRVTAGEVSWFAVRVSLAGIFLWAFLDKTFGLGYATKSANAWIRGGSPTNGFLSHAGGYFSGFYHAIAGNVVTDTLFMGALLGVGLALLFGVGLRVAAVSGAALMLMMWSAATLSIPATNNPVFDDHIVYACVLAAIALTPAAARIGLGNVRVVREHPILQ